MPALELTQAKSFMRLESMGMPGAVVEQNPIPGTTPVVLEALHMEESEVRQSAYAQEFTLEDLDLSYFNAPSPGDKRHAEQAFGTGYF
jgi:hypothetical protein